LVVAAAFFAAWFAVAGRVAWPQGWALLVVFLILVVALTWRLALTDPALLRERTQSSAKAESWDRLVMRLYAVLLLLVMLVAALDGGRFRWSVVPLWAQVTGWSLLSLCAAVIWHVSVTNTFLSRYARIQRDRNHAVVRDGAYRVVRHPMYLGIILLFCGLPLVLASWYSYVPSVAIMGLFVYRTRREDQMLREGLAGYSQYAQEVRYRLVPGIW
jgi:protein-S-isoprenylcysteine O-methyltransferase Ste14